MQRFSILTLARNALTGNRYIEPHWRAARPRRRYEAVIVGGGGHGLAAAWHLARNHGIRDVAVLDAGAIGADAPCGAGLVASDHPDGDCAFLLETSRRRFQTLSRALNFNIRFNPHGCVRLALDDAGAGLLARTAAASRLAGTATRLLAPEELRRLVPGLDAGDGAPLPVAAASWQPDAGTAHRGALAWAYARGADGLGVDIVEHCPVTGLVVQRDRVTGVDTPSGRISAARVVLAAGADTAALAAGAGLDLPLSARLRQFLVLEPARAALRVALAAPALGLAMHQEDSGAIVVQAHAPAAGAAPIELAAGAARAAVRLMPALGGLRVVRRAAKRDALTPDRRPIVGATPLPGLYVTCGWGARSFAGTAVSGPMLAALLAGAAPDPAAAAFGLDRFAAAGGSAPADAAA